MIQSTKTLASFSNSKIAMENMEVFANAWVTQINDLSVLVKDVNDVCQGRSDRQIYLSLPRPGVSRPLGIGRFLKDFWKIFIVVVKIWKTPFLFFLNPLTTIGSPVTHENWPMNWSNFAASPALLGWPARNRHTAACIHRFSHILRRSPVPVVWFMSESRAVANEHEGHKRTLPITSSSFWMTVGVKGLFCEFSVSRGTEPTREAWSRFISALRWVPVIQQLSMILVQHHHHHHFNVHVLSRLIKGMDGCFPTEMLPQK